MLRYCWQCPPEGGVLGYVGKIIMRVADEVEVGQREMKAPDGMFDDMKTISRIVVVKRKSMP